MDINLIRSLVTVAALAAFLGIVWWAYSPARRQRMEEAGRSILEGDER
ncbi:MAG TPA: cbb3-type cytochrome c oxidase subunit 3 [Burkholderiales bacterium]|nr:cbb3-type cytochrome c oxidase subunit 3 [Burkholderiales bacterium]